MYLRRFFAVEVRWRRRRRLADIKFNNPKKGNKKAGFWRFLMFLPEFPTFFHVDVLECIRYMSFPPQGTHFSPMAWWSHMTCFLMAWNIWKHQLLLGPRIVRFSCDGTCTEDHGRLGSPKSVSFRVDSVRLVSDASTVIQQGLVTVPFWVYWTSPYSSHYRPYT